MAKKRAKKRSRAAADPHRLRAESHGSPRRLTHGGLATAESQDSRRAETLGSHAGLVADDDALVSRIDCLESKIAELESEMAILKIAVEDKIEHHQPPPSLDLLQSNLYERRCGNSQEILKTIQRYKQFHIPVGKEGYKIRILEKLYKSLHIVQGIIFCSTREKARSLGRKMKHKLLISSVTGDMSQEWQNAILQQFKTREKDILITTDDSWAGDTISQKVNCVLNYDIPNKVNYLERMNCLGKKGVIISLVTDDEVELLKQDIEAHWETHIPVMPDDIKEFM